MFILSDNDDVPGVWWPVAWTDYDAEGNVHECKVEFRFLRHDRARMGEIYADLAAQAVLLAQAENVSAQLFGDVGTDLVFIKSTADDWRGLGVKKGTAEPVPPAFTDANIRLLLRRIGFAEAYARAHVDFVSKQPEIRRGNSKPSPDGGLATDPKTSRPTTKRAARRSGKR